MSIEYTQNDSAAAAPVTAGWERKTLERLAFAQLEEQKRGRRWKIAFRLAWFLLVVLVLAVAFTESQTTSHPAAAHTAMVKIEGEIASGTPASANNIIGAMRSAMEEPMAKALVLVINSPGGSPVQAGIINDEIKRLRALHNKPVYVVVEEACASAAYYIAVAADDIYVDKASIVGSIGVLMDGFGFTQLMQKLGVERRLMTAGENKGFLDPFSPQSDAQRKHAQSMLDEIHRQFIDAVRKGRGARLKETPQTFSGLFWSGQQAVQLGLADGLGSIDWVARERVKVEEIIDYTHQENVAERLVKRFGASVGQGALQALRSATEIR
jgi:protease IV